MKHIQVEQGTQEWREARVGKITASTVAAVFGEHPWMSRKKLLKTMAAEALGDIQFVTAPPMQWGTDHEDEAARCFAAMYSKELYGVGIFHEGDLAASPDRMIVDDSNSMVEIKCPYGIRNDTSPNFKSIVEQNHYWHQVQCQMYVTGVQRTYFFQWTPHSFQCETVDRDPDWFSDHADDFAAFLQDFHDALELAKSGAPEDIGESLEWLNAVDEWKAADDLEKDAAAKAESAKQALINMAQSKGMEIDEVVGGGVSLAKVARKGSVKWKQMAMDRIENASELEAEYKGSDSVYWRLSRSEKK